MPQVSSIQHFNSPAVSAISEIPAPPVDDERREAGFSFISAAEQDARSAVPSDEGDDIFQNYNIVVFQKEKQHDPPIYIL
jgi:hypothetical protein